MTSDDLRQQIARLERDIADSEAVLGPALFDDDAPRVAEIEAHLSAAEDELSRMRQALREAEAAADARARAEERRRELVAAEALRRQRAADQAAVYTAWAEDLTHAALVLEAEQELQARRQARAQARDQDALDAALARLQGARVPLANRREVGTPDEARAEARRFAELAGALSQQSDLTRVRAEREAQQRAGEQARQQSRQKSALARARDTLKAATNRLEATRQQRPELVAPHALADAERLQAEAHARVAAIAAELTAAT